MKFLEQIRRSKFYPLVLVLLGSTLLSLGWPTNKLGFLLFFGFIPFFELVNYSLNNGMRRIVLFLYLYLGFFIWNLGTTWWVWIADETGATMAFVLNSLFMTIPFLLYHFVKKGVNSVVASLAFISFWLAFEFLHLNWDLSWPWLTLGNGLAEMPSWVQWYEYTGVLGGSVYILVVNITLYRLFTNRGLLLTNFFTVVFLAIAPFIVPVTEIEDLNIAEKKEVVIIQPNVDIETKFDDSKHEETFLELIELTEQAITPQTSYVFWPETAIQGWIKESSATSNESVQKLKRFVQKHSYVNLITGIESFEQTNVAQQKSSTKWNENLGYYETYNTALLINKDTMAFYHKSKLVPGAELTPFSGVVSPLIQLMNFPHMGNYTISDSSFNFYDATPLICYESIYGDYVGEFIQKGAGFLSTITNDVWWENTDGHRQHFTYARLRAIENRKQVLQCANTGISGIFDAEGMLISKTEFDEKTIVKAVIPINYEITFYAKHGDYIGRVAAFLAIVLLLSGFVKKKVKYGR